MRISLSEQNEFFAAHPPRALAGLTCVAVALPDFEFDGRSELVNCIFAVACSCGGQLFTIVSHLMQLAAEDGEGESEFGAAVDAAGVTNRSKGVGDDGHLVPGNQTDDSDEAICSPIELECGACGASYCVFDERKHGFDGELGNRQDFRVADDTGELFLDEIEAPYQVLIRFGYLSDLFDNPVWQDREAEMFSWISLLAKEPTSDLVGLLYLKECR